MTTEGSISEDAASQMLKDLQSWWEIPSMAQYISLFREPFNLPEIEIEELEKGFIDDTVKGPSTWLQNLILAFLKSIMPSRGVNAENWESHLRKLIKRKWPTEEQNPFAEDSNFQQLDLRAKVVIVYSLCLYRLDRNDIVELMKSMDAEALRVQKLGVDDLGNTYWYFYGTRLYKEEAEEKKSWNEEWKRQKKKSFRKRGRGRPRKRMPTSDGESDFEDLNSSKNDGFMNVSKKSRWSVVCDTIEEWVNFAEKFKNSKSVDEKNLFKIIQENFLPTLNKIYEEKEKKLQQKIRELMPVPVREKIVTRRETRRLRGEDVERIPVNGYGSDEYTPVRDVKDRARRLEERNKRASEAEFLRANKRAKKGSERDGGSEYGSSNHQGSDGEDLQSQMEKLLSSVKLHKDAWPFLYPVNEEDAPGYYEIIREPIDLSIIESRLYEGEYETVGDLDADFSKMVSNCELYNGEFHAYSKMAQMLRIMFRKGVAKILDSLQSSESKNADSDGSSDSQYHSNSNSVSPPLESPVVKPSTLTKKSKEKKTRKKRAAQALDLLAHASEIAVQENVVNRTSSPQKKSPVPQQTEVAPHVPSTNMPYSAASTSTSNAPKVSLPVTSSNFVPMNSFPQGTQREKPVIVRTKAERKQPVDGVTTTSLNTVSSINSNNTVSQNAVYRSPNTKTVPVVFSYNNTSPSTQSDLRFKNSPAQVATVQSNMCMPNNMPLVQQVLIPAGSQPLQVQNNGQFVFASPQNAVRLFNKEQNVQMMNNARQVNQGFPKVVPQFLTAAPTVLQVSKDVMSGLQFQAVSQNNSQAFTQVTQSPQFVNIPTYMLTNQSTVNDSSQQPVMNLQPVQ